MKLETEIKIAMTDNIPEDMRDLFSRCLERITLLESALESEAETILNEVVVKAMDYGANELEKESFDVIQKKQSGFDGKT